MWRLLVHVEGQTEETFVNEVLRPQLIGGFGYINVSARLLGNSRPRSGRGGVRAWSVVSRDIVRHLREDEEAISTTMVDYYGMPLGWPGRAGARTLPFADKATAIEDAMSAYIAGELGSGFRRDRFVPFVVMHEYEGLLFSDPPAFAQAVGRAGVAARFQAVRNGFATPEEINDSPLTAPSKRVLDIVPEYVKPFMGVQAARAIGLDGIRRQCPHFDDWVRRLEGAR